MQMKKKYQNENVRQRAHQRFHICLLKRILKAGPVSKAFNFSLVLSQPVWIFFFFFWNLIPTLHFRTTSGKILSVLKIFSHGEKAAQEHFPEAREFPPITSLHPTLHSSFFQLPGTAGYDSIMCLRCL